MTGSALAPLRFKDFVLFGLGSASAKDVSASDSEDVSSRARRGKSLALYCNVVLLDTVELLWKFVLELIGLILGFLLVLFNEVAAGAMIEGTSAFSIDSKIEHHNILRAYTQEVIEAIFSILLIISAK